MCLEFDLTGTRRSHEIRWGRYITPLASRRPPEIEAAASFQVLPAHAPAQERADWGQTLWIASLIHVTSPPLSQEGGREPLQRSMHWSRARAADSSSNGHSFQCFVDSALISLVSSSFNLDSQLPANCSLSPSLTKGLLQKVLLPLTGCTPTIGKSSLSEPSTFSQKCRAGLHKRAACMQMARCAVGSQSVDAGTTQSQNPPPLQPAQ